MSKHNTEVESVDFSQIQNGNEFIIESHEKSGWGINESKGPTYKTFLTAIVRKRFFCKKVEFRMKTEFLFLGINKYVFQSVLIQKLSIGETFEIRLSKGDAKMSGTLPWKRLGDVSKITLVR